jgi:putative tryptophan/tyrosine transport system substrate-binding protein
MAANHDGLHLTRRHFVRGTGLAGLGLLAGCGRLPWQAPARVPRVGWLGTRTNPPFPEAFRQGLREVGYVDSQNVALEYRSADGISERLPDLVHELISVQVEVIVTEDAVAALAASQGTSTIPIVMGNSDPVGLGLAASLARPGSNVTGLSSIAPELAAKRLQLLKEVSPSIRRVAVLWNPSNPVKVREWAEMQNAAGTMSLQLQSLEVRGPDEFENAFATATHEEAEALLVLGDELTGRYVSRITELEDQNRLPAMHSTSTRGSESLMSYGPSVVENFRRAAYYVDRILKGARPADLPIEQPMLFDFVINLRTAQALGLTIPQHVLLQATEIIQ